MSALVHLIYSSIQTRDLSAGELTRLVSQSQDSNLRHGVTGILLHVGNTFFQILEGDPDVIDSLYAKITEDSRHAKVTRIICESIPRRYFGDSLMHLRTLTPVELSEIVQDGTAEDREHLLDGLDEGRAKRLLRAFSDGRWRTQAAIQIRPSEVGA